MSRCSVIIPVHNRASLTRRCLEALLADPGTNDAELIVVDDGSTDVTPQMLADFGGRVCVIRHETALGFATACNSAAAVATGEYLIFLNNDTLPIDGWLGELVACADSHPAAAMIGAKLLYPNGSVQHAGVAICQDRFPRHIYVGLPGHHPAVSKVRRFQAVTAGCCLVRSDVFHGLGGFDPAFHNGFEDIDLCLRLGEAGHEVVFCPAATVYHFEAMTRVGQDHTANTHLYIERWRDRVVPDEFDYYVEDGLLDVGYSEVLPMRMKISPLLAVVSPTDSPDPYELLLRRGREVFDLMRENMLMKAERSQPILSVPARPTALRERKEVVPPELCLLGEPRVHRLNGGSSRVVSVALPLRNAAARLPTLLSRVLDQDAEESVELVAVDSGSDDATLAILREFGARIATIAPQSFDHGLTRQLLAEIAEGDVLVYMTHNSLPADREWLRNLLAAYDADPRVAGVCSRIVPHAEDDILTRRDVERDLSAAKDRIVREITDWDAYRRMTHHELRAFLNFHTVAAALRPSVIREIPFRQMRTIGEDVQWAKDVLEAGYRIQNEPSSHVHHSHRFTYFEMFQRNVDDGIANREIVGRELLDSDVIPSIQTLVRDDWAFLAAQPLPEHELAELRLDAAIRRVAQIVGQWVGVNGLKMTGTLAWMFSRVEHVRAEIAHARSAG